MKEAFEASIPNLDELESLQARIAELQGIVEQMGLELESTGGNSPAAAISATVAMVDAGPFAGLVDLRRFEEQLAQPAIVRDVRVRRYSRGRAQIELALTGRSGLIEEIRRIDRPLTLTEDAGGEIRVELESQDGPGPAGGDPIDPLAARMLPEEVCRHFQLLAVGFDGAALTIAMADPEAVFAQNVAVALSGHPIRIVPAPPRQIELGIDRIWDRLERPDRPVATRQPAFEEIGPRQDEQIQKREPPAPVALPGRFPEPWTSRAPSTDRRALFVLPLVAATAGFVLAPLITAAIVAVICLAALLGKLIRVRPGAGAFSRGGES